MPTSISLYRRDVFPNSTAIRQDAALFAYTQELGTWLSERNLQTVTFVELLAFVKAAHPGASVADEPQYNYRWEWNPVEEIWELLCIDTGRISYGDQSQLGPALLEFKLTAQY